MVFPEEKRGLEEIIEDTVKTLYSCNKVVIFLALLTNLPNFFLSIIVLIGGPIDNYSNEWQSVIKLLTWFGIPFLVLFLQPFIGYWIKQKEKSFLINLLLFLISTGLCIYFFTRGKGSI